MKANSNSRGAIIKFVLLIIIFIVVALIAVKFVPWIVELAKNPSDVRKDMLSIGLLGYATFFLIQLAHVIIAVVPGDFLYVLGGFVFGAPIGFILSYIGVMLGSVMVFYLSRLLGYDFVNRVIPKGKIDKISNILNSVKGMLGLFVICLIPIVPKDPLMYVAGLTPIKASKLFFVYGLSRIPVIFIWTMIGANVYDQNYAQMIIVILILVVLAVSGYMLQKKLLNKSKVNATANDKE